MGARKPSEYGLYFQWGDTQGYTADQVGTGEGQKKFASDWSDYKWRLSGDSNNNVAFTKYKTKGATLDLEDDAAHVNMGGNWHIPTNEQFNELLNNTTSEWTTLDGVNGVTFTSKKDTSKSIFIPAAGTALNGSIVQSGNSVGTWINQLSSNIVRYRPASDTSVNGFCVYIYGSGDGEIKLPRYCGISVRGVIG